MHRPRPSAAEGRNPPSPGSAADYAPRAGVRPVPPDLRRQSVDALALLSSIRLTGDRETERQLIVRDLRAALTETRPSVEEIEQC